MESLSKKMQLSFIPENFKIISEKPNNYTVLRPHPSLSPNSNLIKLPEKVLSPSSQRKPFTCYNLNNREYCLVHLEDNKYCVLSIRMIKNQKNAPISLDKTYNIMFGNKTMSGTVKHIGHKFDCFNQMKRLQAHSEKKEEQLKSNHSGYENELKKKDEIIKNKEEEIKKLNNSIENYKRILDKENLDKIKQFCGDILELYESESSSSSSFQQINDNSAFFSENYPNERVSITTKKTMEEALKSSETSNLAFRKVMTIVFPDVFLWAQNCRKTMVEKYPERIMACYDFVQKKYPDFTFNSACTIMTKISSSSRTKLKHLGYSIVSKYDTMNQTSTHEIFKKTN